MPRKDRRWCQPSALCASYSSPCPYRGGEPSEPARAHCRIGLNRSGRRGARASLPYCHYQEANRCVNNSLFQEINTNAI